MGCSSSEPWHLGVAFLILFDIYIHHLFYLNDKLKWNDIAIVAIVFFGASGHEMYAFFFSSFWVDSSTDFNYNECNGQNDGIEMRTYTVEGTTDPKSSSSALTLQRLLAYSLWKREREARHKYNMVT